MTALKIVASVFATWMVCMSGMAYAGKSTTPATPDVFSPSAGAVVASVIQEIQSSQSIATTTNANGGLTATLPSGTTITQSVSGEITIIPAGGGAPLTFSSSFIASFIAAYL